MSSETVRYTLLQPDLFDPEGMESHEALGNGEWISPYNTRLERLEGQGVIDVQDWDYGSSGSEEIRFSGPPEPVKTDGERIEIFYPNEDNREIQSVQLGTWKCQRCGSTVENPPENGTIEPPQECPGCERRGPFKHKALSEHPDISPSTFSDPEWYTPSGVSDERYAELWSDVRDWIQTYWATSDEYLYDGLTAFVISTWLRPNQRFLSHLLVLGKHETGKTRLLNTLARVAYRGLVPVDFTPAAMYRMVDAYNITLLLSEYHDLKEDRRDETNSIIKGSQKRGENVIRAEKVTDSGFEPMSFDIFTHVGIGAQFEPPDDIISRAIQIQTEPADRDIPTWFDEGEATEIRNRLLYARFRLLNSSEWDAAETEALRWLNQQGIDGRLREKLLSLVTDGTVERVADE
jgi:hypothetical protein